MAIFWIEWQFWSGKSSLATKIAYEVAKRNAKDIAKAISKWWQNHILTNIKMDSEKISNYHYFDDDKFLQVLRTCNSINDIERQLYSQINDWWINKHKRNKYSKFYIFFDEVWAIMNNHLKLENNKTYAVYINQNRKNFEDIYLITAKWWQTNKTLRQMVEFWYYVKPFFNFWFFKNIWIIRKCVKDEEGKIEFQNYIWKDQNWDYVNKQKPLDFYVSFFWKPNIWKIYDDLHKNIDDEEKYIDLDKKIFIDVIGKNPDLIKIVQTKKVFEPLKNFLPKPKVISSNFTKNAI